MEENGVEELIVRRPYLDLKFLGNMKCGLYSTHLCDCIPFNSFPMTRRDTINPHLALDQFKFSIL